MDFILLKVFFDLFRCHIINDIKTWFETSIGDVLDVVLKNVDHCFIFGIFDFCF